MSLMPVATALDRLLASAAEHPPTAVIKVPLAGALGCVLAEPVVAVADVPPWDNSAMDGYALASSDLPAAMAGGLPVSQRITAGMAPLPLQPGTCARIFTGAPLPAGADAVQMQENVVQQGEVAQLQAPVVPGQNVRRRGQDIVAGAQVIAAGVRLRPQELGVIASVGLAEVSVRQPLRVAVVSTGDELVEPGTALAPGQIYNSNRFTLIGLLKSMGQTVLDAGILPDDLDATHARLRELSAEADVIITSGGVSVGEADCLGQALRGGGSVDLWKLAIKPGKPFTLATYAGTPVLGLPGNPAATLVTFLLLVRPYLLTRLGAMDTAAPQFELPTAFAWAEAGTRDEYLRARLEQGAVQLAGNQSSGVLSSASQATGLVCVPAGETFAAGDLVRYLPFSGLLR
ncbi:molybdopterin molybdenumtransferase MoeA [Halopseudomonas pachastrellae]|uniref:Molybdopterin molybdenumtransferase n=1 Tax=Halopseudomonas pachastrellae TaxID=254161 RepID=A0A1S8DF76_9GAMM|nr:gephyrin-like molybdotransferase Glp [Halopseudomonas pachastrellae]ONM44043.1 molybdopterin molybdenumtransferase MoeA [Halopseudomonas pachastrellae]SFM80511.1 molybdopterin molybdotransferase [Halopseudomonas pachastrellae]